MQTEISVRALTPALLQDYLQFFDYDAFTDNPRWASCYCHFNHAPHDLKAWRERGLEENRAAAIRLIERNELHGYLAYINDYVVGWCNANVRTRYTTFPPDAVPMEENIAAVVCFVVAQSYRGMGVARKLLDAALEGFQRAGIESVYAFARTDTNDQAANHHGPLALYLEAGFEKIEERPGVALLRKTF